jgi:hypothetical protein
MARPQTYGRAGSCQTPRPKHPTVMREPSRSSALRPLSCRLNRRSCCEMGAEQIHGIGCGSCPLLIVRLRRMIRRLTGPTQTDTVKTSFSIRGGLRACQVSGSSFPVTASPLPP